MSQRTSAAAAKKAAAARAEKQSATKSVTWRGLDLQLPDELPATVAFDLAELQASGDDITVIMRFLGGVIGAENLARVRAKVAEDGDTLNDVGGIVMDLIALTLDEYGISLGESEASPTS